MSQMEIKSDCPLCKQSICHTHHECEPEQKIEITPLICPIESLLVLSPDNKLTININELFNQANKGGEQKIILTRKQIEAAMDKCSHPQVQQARYNSHLQSILKELGFADE